MSTTEEVTGYTISGGVSASTPGGTQANGAIELTIAAGSDFTDADAFAIQEALVAAFPADWAITSAFVPLAKQDNSQTQYTTDYTTKTFT